MTNRPLRDYQAQAIAAVRDSLARGHKRPVMMLPTGAGKTRIAAEIVRLARANGRRVMFVVPAISLIDQTVDSFAADGITDVGVIQGSHWMTKPEAPVQVCSIQTLERRDLPVGIGLVIVDECHRTFRFLTEWMADWSSVSFVGLSATPWSPGMAKHWDDLIVGNTIQGMIDAGYLAPFRVYAPGHPDLSGVKIVAGDYHEGQLGDAMDKAPLIADIVRSWKNLGENRPTLLFAVNRAHAKHCQLQFIDAGVPAEYIDAHTEPEERRIIGTRLARGEVKVVCNVGCLTTGVDWDVRCIVFARPTRSEILFVQMVGRGLRLADGKSDCILIDHSDTHQSLGFVTDIHHDTLDDGKKKPKAKNEKPEKQPKECPKCHYLRPAKTPTCPACGYVPAPQHGVEHVDGELIEVTRSKASMAEKQDWYSMLLFLADKNGRKDGWAAHKYRAKFGVWPNKLSQARKVPTADVERFVKAEQIRWAKGIEARNKAKEPALTKLDEMFAR